MGSLWTIAEEKHGMSYQLAEKRKTSTAGGEEWETEPFSPQLNRGDVGSSLGGQGRAGVSLHGKTEMVAPFSVPSGPIDSLVLQGLLYFMLFHTSLSALFKTLNPHRAVCNSSNTDLSIFFKLESPLPISPNQPN